MAQSCHNKKRKSEVLYINRDGWVVTRDGAFGDNGEDCTLYIDLDLRSIRKTAKLSQQEMAWIIGSTRATYHAKEKGTTRLFLAEYFALLKTKELNQLLINDTI